MVTVNPDTDLYWLAGLLEGEGHFGIYRNTSGGKIYTYPIIQLGMNDQDIVLRVTSLVGSYCKCYHYTNRGNRQPRWVTSVTCARARELMQLLRPLMGKRRQQQIDKALQCDIRLPRKQTKQHYNHLKSGTLGEEPKLTFDIRHLIG